MSDGVEKHDAVVRHQLIYFGEELVVALDADVLEHANRHDAVKLLIELAIIPQLKLDTITDTGSLGAFYGKRVLLFRKRDAEDVNILHLREIDRKTTPPAADIEELLAWAQTQLRSNQPAFGPLRRFKCVVVILEVGARVEQAIVQKQAIKLIPDIVVVSDVLLRPANGVGLLEALELSRDGRDGPMKRARRPTRAVSVER